MTPWSYLAGASWLGRGGQRRAVVDLPSSRARVKMWLTMKQLSEMKNERFSGPSVCPPASGSPPSCNGVALPRYMCSLSSLQAKESNLNHCSVEIG